MVVEGYLELRRGRWTLSLTALQNMKICPACSQSLPKEKFSKKQWQLKQQKRRCKECIAENRVVNISKDAPNDKPLLSGDIRPPHTDGVSSAKANTARSISELETGITGMKLKEEADAAAAAAASATAVVYADKYGSATDCDRTEVANNATAVTDEDLFKEPPPTEECPICMIPLSLSSSGRTYYPCCGKTLCIGCTAGMRSGGRRICAFCRAPWHGSDGEWVECIKKRVESNDAIAMRNLGGCYHLGIYGLPRDYKKAMKLLLRAGELGCAAAYNNLGYAYDNGEGVERDMEKAKYYYELAAIGGDAYSRHNVGLLEWHAGNFDRAVKHCMISARAGYDNSLVVIRQCFLDGHATKSDFEKALRAHKDSKDEMKSDKREEAAAIIAARRQK